MRRRCVRCARSGWTPAARTSSSWTTAWSPYPRSSRRSAPSTRSSCSMGAICRSRTGTRAPWRSSRPPCPSRPERPSVGASEVARTEEDPMSDGPQSLIPALPPAPEPTAPAPSKRKALIAGAIVGGLILGTGLTSYAFLQGGNAEAQPLALSFTQGQSQTYEIHQTMDADISSDVLGSQPISMDITQVVGWEVVSVTDGGTATTEVTGPDMSGTMNGPELPDTPVPPIGVVVA